MDNRLLEICDEMASGEDFVNFHDIFERYYGHKIKLEGDRKYASLRQQLNRMNRQYDFIEFKNNDDLRGGFRYKKGFEYFFSNRKEKTTLKKLEGNEKKLFKTGGLQMLFDGESSCEHYVELEWTNLENLELVKKLISYIQEKRVISFRYLKGYCEEIEIIMHPFLLKEYNSRWFLFGYICQQDYTGKIINVSLDRIIYDAHKTNNVDKKIQYIKVHPEIKYKPAPQNFNIDYFKDIVGVTRSEDDTVEEIRIKTVNFKVHHLLRTKPIHPSQIESVSFDALKMEGEFTIKVIPNIELQTRLLSYGPGLYIIGEGKFQQQMRNAVLQMAKLYTI
jgi:hypothetical protein